MYAAADIIAQPLAIVIIWARQSLSPSLYDLEGKGCATASAGLLLGLSLSRSLEALKIGHSGWARALPR